MASVTITITLMRTINQEYGRGAVTSDMVIVASLVRSISHDHRSYEYALCCLTVHNFAFCVRDLLVGHLPNLREGLTTQTRSTSYLISPFSLAKRVDGFAPPTSL